ncbi:MAG: T9SS type A sorting domain-containing protein, partial [Ferruginibacter sp.]
PNVNVGFTVETISVDVLSESNSTLPAINRNQKADINAIDTRVAKSLEVIAYPNPSDKHFTVQLGSNDVKTKIQMQVSDQYGRLLEKRENVIIGSMIQLGRLYRPGIYYVRIIQGKDHKEIKLVKL